MIDVSGIKARLANISPGQWERHGAHVHAGGSPVPMFFARDGESRVRQQADRDAEFTAAAPEDIAALLTALAKCRAEVAELNGRPSAERATELLQERDWRPSGEGA